MDFLTNMFYWGLSYNSIVKMFDLNNQDVEKSILDCMGAPSSFNPIGNKNGKHVVSCNDIYGSSKQEIENTIPAKLQQTMTTIEDNPERFMGATIGTLKEFKDNLHTNMKIFLDDYDSALKQKEYLPTSLPDLEFANCEFSLAICRHFLFARNLTFSVDFHVQCITEMCRVAGETRIFPLLNAAGEVSEKLAPVMKILQDKDYDVEIRKVDYELQKGGNAMLRVWHQQCPIQAKR